MPVACRSRGIEFRFEDGVLWIREPVPEHRLRWRPEPLAEEKGPRGRWRECWPALRLLAPATERAAPDGMPEPVGPLPAESGAVRAIEEQKRQAFLAFRGSIPGELAALVERFPSHQWAMLWLVAREQSVLDLAHSNPVLAYAMANHGDLRGFTPRTAAALALGRSRLKQKEILAWLGFPAAQSMVKLFRKIAPEAVTPSSLRLLRVAVERRPEVVDMLRHHPRINAGILGLVIDPWAVDCVTPLLLSEVAGDGRQLRRAETAHLLRKALRLVQAIDARRPPPLVRSMAAAERLHRDAEDELLAYRERRARERIAEIERRERMLQEHRRLAREARAWQRRAARRDAGGLAPLARAFPPPPVPGTAEIIPITSREELCAEGEAQRNCVASYEDRIPAGFVYIYRVLAPERATLSIVRRADGSWRRDELKGRSNRKVSSATQAFVDKWLASHRAKGSMAY